MTFQEFGLHPDITRVLPEIGYENPTPIQEQSIPLVMSGRDMLGSAQTGTGKTAAFLLPVLHRLLENPGRGLQVLVLEPTRELAMQVEEQARLFSKYTPFRAAMIVGGVAFGPQEQAFQSGVEIIAATPGRLLDHLRQGNVRFDQLKVLVLDEADRMLDMGFLPDVRSILRALPKERQTLFFSATIPGEVHRLSETMLRDPAQVAITPDRKTAEGITQAVYQVSDHLKGLLLQRLLEHEHVTSALVFTRTKQGADKVCAVVESKGLAVRRIHGDLSQAQRLKALSEFKEGVAKFLVATDIAARGLDIEGISHVINYDLPESPDDYVHRVGRTARAQATGTAYSLASPRDAGLLAGIERHLGHKLEKKQMEGFDYEETLGVQHEVRQGHDGINSFERLGRGAAAKPSKTFTDSDENASLTLRWAGSAEGGAESSSPPAEGGFRSQAPSGGDSSDPKRRRRRGRGGRGGGGGAGRDGGGAGGRDAGRSEARSSAPPRDSQRSSSESFGQGGARREEEQARRQATQAMSATDVLRIAGNQRAAVESSAMELRPRSMSEPDSEPVAQENARAPQVRNDQARMDQPRGDGGPRRRRRRGRGGRGGGEGRGEEIRGTENRNGNPQRQGDRGRGPNRGPSRPSVSASSSGGGFWAKVKATLGIGQGPKESDSSKW